MSKKLRSIILIMCLATALNTIAAAQKTADSDVGGQPANVNENEKAEFYKLTDIAFDALASGESGKAKFNAEVLLKKAESFRENWNYGNAFHIGNLVLGQIAFDSGDLDEAKRFLLEAGKTPGSPQLNTFGPNMLLAKELLANQEYEAVLKYFELCAKFWDDRQGSLEQWKNAVLKKEMPDFGANLVYGISSLYLSKRK